MWVKEIIKNRNNLKNVMKIIKHFNHGVNEDSDMKDPYQKKVSHLIINDLLVQPIGETEYEKLIWEADNFKTETIIDLKIQFIHAVKEE